MIQQQHALDMFSLIRPYRSEHGKIRVGSPHDGGYVISDDLSDIEGVVSIGIGGEVSFDMFFAERGVQVFQYDHTVENTPYAHENLIFRKLAWGPVDGPGSRSLDTILAENGLADANELILKFDVEGGEYEALSTVSAATLARFRIITAEFHYCGSVSDPLQFARLNRAFSLLHQTHLVTHLHANNYGGVRHELGLSIPDALEISFLRRDRGSFQPCTDPIPSRLDHPNCPTMPDIVLTPFLHG